MSTLHECGLCGQRRQLRVSHFMPAALYPKNKKKALATLTHTVDEPEHIVDSLLCHECESKFNRNGESEVLRWMAPKAKNGTSPLLLALRQTTPTLSQPDLTCHLVICSPNEHGAKRTMKVRRIGCAWVAAICRAMARSATLTYGNTQCPEGFRRFEATLNLRVVGSILTRLTTPSQKALSGI